MTTDTWQERLDTLRAAHRVPGAALAVLVDGELHELASGVLNRETGLAVTPDSLFQSGSIAKIHTATAAMRLVDAGRLDLDARVVDVLPEFGTPDPAATALITVRHLLTHTAGLTNDFHGNGETGDDAIAKYVEAAREVPLDLPPRTLRTVAVWWTLNESAILETGLSKPDIPGSLHAAEHAAIGLLPLVATCDRWDIGGLSTPGHADTEAPTVFVYDGHHGGAGFAERGYTAWRDWLTATRDAIGACGCEFGCPSCVQSPKCGNGNDPLDKAGAVKVLNLVLGAQIRRC